MRFTKDGLEVEVVLSHCEIIYPEYGANEEPEDERSCFIGVSSGQKLQIHLRYTGHWPETKADVIIDGKIRRFVQQRGISHQEIFVKYVDQV